MIRAFVVAPAALAASCSTDLRDTADRLEPEVPIGANPGGPVVVAQSG